jgi:streptogramin lyase
VRLDHSTGAVTATVDVGARPGEMTSEPSGLHGATIWSFHRLSGKVTRIDAQSTSASSVDLPGVTATGLALEGNSLWMLSTNPDRIVELDDQTLQMKRSIDLRPPFAHRPSSVDTGSLAGGEQGLWAVLPGYRAIALVDTTTGTVRYYHVPYGTPSSLAVGAGFLWVATNHAVLQFDEKTVSLKAAAIVPSAPRTGIMSIAFGYAAAWVANYDRGTLARVPLPVP